MNKIVISLLLISLCPVFTVAQSFDIKIKILSANDNLPLPGASVFIQNTDKGSITDINGYVIFEDLEERLYTFTISYVGFTTLEHNVMIDQSKEIIIKLTQDTDELETVILQSNRSTRTIKKIPTRIEFIGGEELAEKNMMNATNISMVLRESTGIQMQQTSLSSGNSNIRIQGLDGRYTQLLRDGFPLFGGFSSGLSIMQIPPLDLKQFEIIKGSSSTLYGGGAIAGLVNLVSKTPDEEPEMDIMFTQTQALGTTGNIFYSQKRNKVGWTIYGSGHYQKAFDPDDDGFSNLPNTNSISLNPKIFYYPSDKTSFWLGINGTFDKRKGGDIDTIENNNENLYSESNTSKRLSSQVVYTTQPDSTKVLTLKNSISFFDRELALPDYKFTGKQWNTFSEASYSKTGKRMDWVIGGNLYTSSFTEDHIEIPRDQEDITYGGFINTIFDISKHWILEAGLRTDYAVDWGFFALPRMSLLYKNDTGFSSRIGGGLGYKIPDIFTEEAEFINYQDVIPINKDDINPEKSIGLNLDFNYQFTILQTLGVSFNQLFYLTSIDNALLLNSTGSGQFVYENAGNPVLSRGAETNLKFSYKDFRWFLNYALIDTKLTYLPGDPQKPLTAKHNAGSVIMYESEKWRFGYETYYTGKQVLSNGEETTDYITMGLLGVRNFSWGSIYANFENFTDIRQSNYTPLVIGPRQTPSFTEIYAPVEGFIFSLGVIIKPFGNETHH